MYRQSPDYPGLCCFRGLRFSPCNFWIVSAFFHSFPQPSPTLIQIERLGKDLRHASGAGVISIGQMLALDLVR
jgi:hypothetical protein